jgi:hypothetical protein
MKKIKSIILLVFVLIINGCSGNIDKTTHEINPIVNDGILKFDSTLIQIYLMDTIKSIGLYKYLSPDFHKSNIIAKKTILKIGEKKNITKIELELFIRELDSEFIKFHEKCIECGDRKFNQESKKSILVTKLYLFCKLELFSKALKLLDQSTLSFNEISTIILLKNFGLNRLQNELQKHLKPRREIRLFNLSYNIKTIRVKYRNESLSFFEYFEKSNSRLNEFGI